MATDGARRLADIFSDYSLAAHEYRANVAACRQSLDELRKLHAELRSMGSQWREELKERHAKLSEIINAPARSKCSGLLEQG